MNAADDERRARWEAGVDAAIIEMRHDLTDLRDDTREMRDKLAGRPTWAVTTAITTLTTLCGVLCTLLAITVGMF